MTLTFLVLAGQVKVKGQLGEMAECLGDSGKRIAGLSKNFFSELATKDSPVYNHFVDMFSLLSAEKGLSEEAFEKIIKFLATFIEKDSVLSSWRISLQLGYHDARLRDSGMTLPTRYHSSRRRTSKSQKPSLHGSEWSRPVPKAPYGGNITFESVHDKTSLLYNRY